MTEQLGFFKQNEENFQNLHDACLWASKYLNRKVTVSNLSYLLQYGRINKYGNNGNPLINMVELKHYYDSTIKSDHSVSKYGKDVNWNLSFVEYSESERTKHVHRLHPYKGKFIPQLVEYFLDSHVDEYKKQIFFNPGDIVLDPFCGSGTTLVESNVLGMHAIGVDISSFNSMIANVKVEDHNLLELKKVINEITFNLKSFQKNRNIYAFESELLCELSKFNSRYFPSPDYRKKIRNGIIDEKTYSSQKENEFLIIFNSLIRKYKIQIKQENDESFLEKWFLFPVREEIDFLLSELHRLGSEESRRVLSIIFSRTIRSCRATTHADLATLKEPIISTYYCRKHGKICKPIFSLMSWWKTYTRDTIERLNKFRKIRTHTYQFCITGDSRIIDLDKEIMVSNPQLFDILKKEKIRGIFTSPPYVGLIDYHEQHAYAYELFNQKRNDNLEIGPLYKGQGREAQHAYVAGIAKVLNNVKKFLQSDYDIFIVANDKFHLYPKIAELSGMRIYEQYKRPVLNRVEKDRNTAYSETIFHFKEIE